MTGLAEFLAMGGYAFYVWTAFGLSFLLIVTILVWSAYEQRQVRRESFAVALRERDRKRTRDRNRHTNDKPNKSQASR